LEKYITGGHVAEYMESLEEEDDERWVVRPHFSFRLSRVFFLLLFLAR
jgi:hypothetical protein